MSIVPIDAPRTMAEKDRVLYRLVEALSALEDGRQLGVSIPASDRDAIEHLCQAVLVRSYEDGLLDPDVYGRFRQILNVVHEETGGST